MTSSQYTYSNGDLLKNPQKYHMTPFLDKKFLNDYLNSRNSHLEKRLISHFKKNKIITKLNENIS